MIGFLVGWGVFWLLFWLAIALLGWVGKADNALGVGVIFSFVSVAYLIAVGVGYAVAS
jgi:hypothetical protein